MAKKTTEKKEAAKASAKARAKAKKPDQLKLEGTGRTDAIPELDKAGEAYREARDARMEMQEEETAAQDFLTACLKKHGKTDYVYEGADGKQYRATIAEAKAKVKRIVEKKAPAASE